jgi:hypothetical protein
MVFIHDACSATSEYFHSLVHLPLLITALFVLCYHSSVNLRGVYTSDHKNQTTKAVEQLCNQTSGTTRLHNDCTSYIYATQCLHLAQYVVRVISAKALLTNYIARSTFPFKLLLGWTVNLHRHFLRDGLPTGHPVQSGEWNLGGYDHKDKADKECKPLLDGRTITLRWSAGDRLWQWNVDVLSGSEWDFGPSDAELTAI